MAGFDYLDFLKNYGTGSRGASGRYSNMNRSMPGIGNFMQQGQKAGGNKFIASGVNHLAQGNIKEGIKSGIGYALNQNPYIAGINMFNDLTGGIRFDKMLGMGPKKPQLTKAQREVDANFAQQMSDDRNAYLKQSGEAADQGQRYNEYVNSQRNILTDLQQNGMSARSLAPMLGQFANINEQAAGAARSNVAANLSRRGLDPSSGIGIGATTGVENSLASQQGQQRAMIANQVMQDVSQFRNQMTAQDAASADKAYARSSDLRDSAAMLPIRQAMLQMEQQKLDQQRDQQMFERRQAEQASFGKFAGQFGPGLLNEYQRMQNRNNPAPGMTSDQIVEDFRNSERRAAVPAMGDNFGGPIMQDPTFDNLGVRNNNRNMPVNPQAPAGLGQFFPSYDYNAGSSNNQPNMFGDNIFNAPVPNSFLPRENPAGRGDYSTLGQGGILSNDDTQARSEVFNMQNPYALDGQIIEYQGQFFRKTQDGWEQIG